MSKADRTRERILDAARQLLESGEPASMSAIADAAGVTRQLLYVHFDGRADLLLQLSRRIDETVRTPAVQARVDDAASAVDALRETVAVQGLIKPSINAVAAAIDRMRHDDRDAARAWDEREAARHQRCLDVTRRMRKDGRLRAGWSPESAARLVWSLTSQRAWQELVAEGDWTTAAWVRHTTRTLESTLVDETATGTTTAN